CASNINGSRAVPAAQFCLSVSPHFSI
ncbi:unnamed protein product, partial [Allacma fusca]